MRVTISGLSPLVTPWKRNQELVASSWSARDEISWVSGFAEKVRVVKHYSTEMVEFVIGDDNSVEFAGALSVGYGSVTDQKGVNTLFASVDSPLRMKRDTKGGGARIVNITFGNVVATRDGVL